MFHDGDFAHASFWLISSSIAQQTWTGGRTRMVTKYALVRLVHIRTTNNARWKNAAGSMYDGHSSKHELLSCNMPHIE